MKLTEFRGPPLPFLIEEGMVFTRRQVSAIELKSAGLTRAEVAAEMGITPKSVKEHWRRARRRAVSEQSAYEPKARALYVSRRPVRVRPFSLLPGEV